MHKIASRIVHRNLETIALCIDTSTEDEETNVQSNQMNSATVVNAVSKTD